MGSAVIQEKPLKALSTQKIQKAKRPLNDKAQSSVN